MSGKIVYVQCDSNVICKEKDVRFSDVGTLLCDDPVIAAKCKAVKVHHFQDTGFVVVNVLKIIEEMMKACPGIQVVVLGEEEVVLEPAFGKKEKKAEKTGGWKILLVSLICFFGPGFTIMAFQNDVGVNDVFALVYELLMGEEVRGLNILQVAYAVGLALGILLFFNHVGKKKITSDPTPIQVSMKNYEDDVNKTLVQMAKRGGMEQNV